MILFSCKYNHSLEWDTKLTGTSYTGGESENYPDASIWTYFYAGNCDFLNYEPPSQSPSQSPTLNPTIETIIEPTPRTTLSPTLYLTPAPTLGSTIEPTPVLCRRSTYKLLSFDMQVDENGARENTYQIHYYNNSRNRFMFLENGRELEHNGTYSLRTCRRPVRACYRLKIVDRSKNGFGHFSFSFDGKCEIMVYLDFVSCEYNRSLEWKHNSKSESHTGGEPENYPNSLWIHFYLRL